MPRISELPPLLGINTSPDDLFVTVDVSDGRSGTKNITRQELVRSLSDEVFQGIEIRDGTIINSNIILTEMKPYEVESNDYIPLTDHRTNITYRYDLVDLRAFIIGDTGTPGELFVDPVNGSDDELFGNGGRISPFQSIAKAVAKAATDDTIRTITLISGTHVLEEEVVVPENFSIRSLQGPYLTTVHTAQPFAFSLNSGSVLEGVSVRGMKHDNTTLPTTGFVARFAQDANITVPPLLRNVTQFGDVTNNITSPTDKSEGNPLFPFGAGLFFADASVLNADSLFATAVLKECRCASHNGNAVVAANGATVQVTSIQTESARATFVTRSGGSILSLNGSTSFGDYSAIANGHREVVVPASLLAPITARKEKVQQLVTVRSDLINDLELFILMGGFVFSDYISIHSKKLLDACLADIYTGTQVNTKAALSAIFPVAGLSPLETNSTLRTNFVTVVNQIPAIFNNRVALTIADLTDFDAVIKLTERTLTSIQKARVPSCVVMSNHTFFKACAGVGLDVTLGNGSPIGDGIAAPASIFAEDGGIVKYTGQDQLQNSYLPGGIVFDGLRGRVKGGAMKRLARNAGRRFANSRSNMKW